MILTRRLALIAAVLAALTLAPAAQAAPRPSGTPTVVARIPVPSPTLLLAYGLGSEWFVDQAESNYSTLRRIDPSTNQIVASHLLDSTAGGLAAADGSLWVAMYYDNVVERISPSGRVLARIPAGLQPEEVYAAFGALWVANHHGRSLSRIDPRRNRVVATLPFGDQATFRNGPQQFSDDGRYLYVYASNGDRPFGRIDPRTDAVTTYPMTNDLCGQSAAAGPSVFLAYCDQDALLQIDTATGTVLRDVPLPGDGSSTDFNHPATAAVTFHGHVWAGYATVQDPDTGAWSGGRVAEIDPVTGAVLQTVDIGGDVSNLWVGGGDLWISDDTDSVVLRLQLP